MNLYIVTYYPDPLADVFGGRPVVREIVAENKPAALREARATCSLEVNSVIYVSTLRDYVARLQDQAEQLSRNPSVPAHLINAAWIEHNRARALLAS